MTTLTPGLGLLVFGIWEALFVFGILMLLFGAKKLPDLARGLGGGIRNFKGELEAPPEKEKEQLEEPDEIERQI